LQVAVDDEDEIVEMLAAPHAQGTDGLGLVHLAVADEAPDPLALVSTRWRRLR